MTRHDFSKTKQLFICLGIPFLIYGGFLTGLHYFAQWMESHYNCYPWKSEDYLRILLPDLFDEQGRTRIMLAGPSEAREGLLYELFDNAFDGMHAFQGALSLGTMQDFLLSLEYIERIYGKDAMPNYLVLGLTPRFVANIPDRRPFSLALNRYSPYFCVEKTASGSRLVPKNKLEGLWSAVKFFTSKQQKRYQAAILSFLSHLFSKNERSNIDFLLNNGNEGFFQGPVSDIMESGFLHAIHHSAFVYTSPYKFIFRKPLPSFAIQGWINEQDSFWYKTHRWNPMDDSAAIRVQFNRLLALTKKHGISLFVINLPEHEFNRNGFHKQYYEDYLRLVKASIHEVPFLNLRLMLENEAFYDPGHPTMDGAIRVTNRIIHFIKDWQIKNSHGSSKFETGSP